MCHASHHRAFGQLPGLAAGRRVGRRDVDLALRDRKAKALSQPRRQGEHIRQRQCLSREGREARGNGTVLARKGSGRRRRETRGKRQCRHRSALEVVLLLVPDPPVPHFRGEKGGTKEMFNPVSSTCVSSLWLHKINKINGERAVGM